MLLRLYVLQPLLLVPVCQPILVACLNVRWCLLALVVMRVGVYRSAPLGTVAFLFLLGAALGTVVTSSLLVLISGLQGGAMSTDSPGATFNFEADERAIWHGGGQAGGVSPVMGATCSAQVAQDLEALRSRKRKSDPSCRSSETNVWGIDSLCSHDPGLVAWAMDTGGGQVDFEEADQDFSWIPASINNRCLALPCHPKNVMTPYVSSQPIILSSCCSVIPSPNPPSTLRRPCTCLEAPYGTLRRMAPLNQAARASVLCFAHACLSCLSPLTLHCPLCLFPRSLCVRVSEPCLLCPWGWCSAVWNSLLEQGNRELEAAAAQLQQHTGPCFSATPLGQILQGAMEVREEGREAKPAPQGLGG